MLSAAWLLAGPRKFRNNPVSNNWQEPSKYLALLALLGGGLLAAGVDAATGSNRQALATTVLRVCADPANLPYSNRAGEGFENRIVDLIAEELGLKVHYTWYPQSTGFVRNTLRLRQCDLIAGITTTSEKVQNTNPYYHSVYSMVYRKDSGLNASSMSDPTLKNLKLGVVAGTPPATAIAQLGLLGNVRPYHLITDTRRYKPAQQAIIDVDSGKTDVAFVWGPIAAYYTSQAKNELVLVPLTREDSNIRLNFRVSMAVRYNETDWKHTINAVLKSLEEDITKVLREYRVPLLDERGELIEE